MRNRLILLSLLVGVSAAAGPVDRPWEPVVVTGAQVSALRGAAVDRIVAFRYAGGWQQVPVQVDERAVVDWSTIYDGLVPPGLTVLTYTDPGTFTGADPDPAFDDDDEIVWMARDMGAAAPAGGDPAGVVAGSRVELLVSDPLDGGESRIYLFRGDGTLDPGMGRNEVRYSYNLLAGAYLTDFKIDNGPNPEDSDVLTPFYRVHFADRWIRDGQYVSAGGASNVDVLDRHKSQFAPGDCARTEDTFSAGEGAFMANRSGAIRAIRAYVGANSGVLTYRVHRFYDRQEEIVTALQVHAISGVVDYFDYAPAASGMRYANSLNTTAQIVIDGSPDSVQTGDLDWEIVSGAQGTLAIAHRLDTTIAGLDMTSYYLDSATPTVTQCTGDAHAYGQSGPRRDGHIPNTDPSVGPADRFEMVRTIRYGPPTQDNVFAETLFAEVSDPLSVTVGGGGGVQPPGAPTNLHRTDTM